MLRSPRSGGRMPLDPFEVLRSVPLFAQVPEGDLRALAQLVRERTHPRGSLILTQGDPGEALFLIRSGQVKVSVVAEDGREVILSVLGPGSFFGEMAMEDPSLLQRRREDFRSRLRSSPELSIALLRELSRRLRRADDTITSLMLLDVNGRVAHLLLERSEEHTSE